MKFFPSWRRFAKTATLMHQLLRDKRSTAHSHQHTSAALSSPSTSAASGHIQRKVLISSSQNIFENLALEEWLYENAELRETDYLLMWRNSPAVVIGRHQNPWMECDVQRACQDWISVVRRTSGGGTVYHDEGNLNLSFLKHRGRYDRRKNLSLVVEAVTSRWDLDLDLNCRDDLVLDGVYKVSGTASKLGRSVSYHHFTLMFDVDREVLSSILHSPLMGVDSKATKSVPSLVKNLTEEAPDMTFDMLVKVIGQQFLQDDENKGVAVVSPGDEGRFPGVTAIQQRLSSWEWTFGKTPPFTVARTFTKAMQDSHGPYSQYSLRTLLAVEKGRLRDISLTLSAKPRGSNGDVELPFRLLDLVDLTGERLGSRGLSQVWERCERRVREEEEEEDYDLLQWGLQCVMKCVPVAYDAFRTSRT